MSEQSGKPGRYQRSASGLVASLLVTGGLVLLAVWLMGLFRSSPVIEPTPVDHIEAVRAVQADGQRPVYPLELPEGWIATGFDVESGGTSYGLKLLTADEAFVGVAQTEESAGTLLRRHVEEDEAELEEIADYTATQSVAEEWSGWADASGDTAYAADVGETTVLVYGSAPPGDLQELVERLTREPLRD